MATVHRGEDALLRREVAIKLLHKHVARHEPLRARFLREARAAAGLDHPGILKIYDVGAEDPPFIVMELLSGRSLKAFLDESGPPLAEMAALIGATLARALAVAHAAGVVHRDIKPANVMVTGAGRLVVCDFGLARVDDDALATQTGETLGTPAFMSPEQALGRRVDARTDVYSLGATVYQLATGALPFSGSSAAVLQRVIRGEVDPPTSRNPAVGSELQAVILGAMARDPDARYPTATALAEALGGIAASVDLALGDLVEYFADPGSWNARMTPRVLAAACVRARAAVAAGKKARALAITDRVLAIEPSHPDAMALAGSLGVGAGRRRQASMVAGTAAAIALVGLGVVGWIQLRAPTATRQALSVSASAPAPAPDSVSVSVPDSVSDSVSVSVSVSDAASASVPVAAPAPAPASAPEAPPPLRAPSHPAPRPPRPQPVAAPAILASQPDAPPPPPPARATLDVKIHPWCEIAVDNIAHGRSPSAPTIDLLPGHHTLVCTQPNIVGGKLTRDLELAPGEHKTIEESLYRNVPVKIGLASGQTTIDDRSVAAGATVSIAPGRHKIEVRIDDEHFGPTYIDVPTRPCVLRVRPELGCYDPD